MSSVDRCATLVRQVMCDSRGVVRMSCGPAYRIAADPGVYPSRVPRKVVIGRSPWRWAIAAIGLLFAGLELPEMFGPLPDYAQHDNFETLHVLCRARADYCCGTRLRLLRLPQRSPRGRARTGDKASRRYALEAGVS